MFSKSSTDLAESVAVGVRALHAGVFVCLLWLTCSWSGGCGSVLPINDEDEFSLVSVSGTTLLEAPAVGRHRAYVPNLQFAVDPDSDGSPEAVGFTLSVVTTEPDRLAMQLIDLVAGTTSVLAPLSGGGSLPDSAETPFDSRQLHSETRSLLESGTGTFWRHATSPLQSIEHRFAVVIPSSLLSSFARLKVYVSTTDDGTPIGADDIELVKGFFYMGVLGDSLQWGNGLRDEDKIYARTTQVIEAELGVKVIPQVLAVSAATIVPPEDDGYCEYNCTGEVPRAPSSITLQAHLLDHPELIDLILLTGCANDIGLITALEPGALEDIIPGLAEQFCEHEMLNLLRFLRSIAPHARIVVMSYYRMLSELTDLPDNSDWLETLGLAPGDISLTNTDDTVEAAGGFEELSRKRLIKAVDAINAEEEGDAMVGFSRPVFAAENAILAPNSWLWGLTNENTFSVELDESLKLFPEDPLAQYRQVACFYPDVSVGRIGCLYGSVGHPNPKGAQAYADAIVKTLRSMGVLAAETPASN